MRERANYERRIGEVIDGKWRLGRLIGYGTESAVYEAIHRNGCRVAIKILGERAAQDPDAVRRFLHQAYGSNGMGNRVAVTVHDDGIVDGTVYLVLDLKGGETLEEMRMRSGGRLGLEVVLRLASDLEAALDDARDAGVVYPTLQAHDVFVTNTGEIKLLDFGIKSDDPSWARADVRTVGALLYFLLSGTPASRDTRSLTTVAPWIDHRVAAVIDLAFARDEGAGWPDVGAMRAALDEATKAALDSSAIPANLQAARSSTPRPRAIFTLSTIANTFQ